MIVFQMGGKPIKAWVPTQESIEWGAQEQAMNLSKLPFAFRHIAIMPDVHRGMGMPIGGILAADQVVVPNAVGVDIGCGMCAVKTSMVYMADDLIKKVMGEIRQRIPLGRDWHEDDRNRTRMPDLPMGPVVEKQYGRAVRQMGTLGGGNHFIEIQKGDDDHIWLMLHSGSRNLGKQVGDYHNKVAKEWNARYHSSVPAHWGLAYLPLKTQEFDDYWKDMDYCVEFARLNRLVMMEQVVFSVMEHIIEVTFEEPIDVSHNYADWENHFKKNVIVHRKGAIRAREGEPCIIPGCQGGYSYICKGLGNPQSFHSASHGAGRVMSRTQAKRELNLEDELKKMEGCIHGIRSQGDLDEAPSAYKDIDEVIANEADLVEPLVKMRGIAVIKG